MSAGFLDRLSDLQILANTQKIAHTWLEEDIDRLFKEYELPDPLGVASCYAMKNGGKRVRPLLVLVSFLVASQHYKVYSDDRLALVRRAMLAVELIHGYSLVHDDLPCMDDDALRRGKPTCHIIYGEATALLAGDVLQSLAFSLLSDSDDDPACVVQLQKALSQGARCMVAGQQLDLSGEKQALGQTELERIHKDKTGALIRSAVVMGGICGGANQEDLAHLSEYARLIGLAFQVQDDVLDVTSDQKTLGKPIGSDEKLQKSTYVQALGIEQATVYASDLFDKAKKEVEIFGDQNLLLQTIDWLQKRTH